MLSASEIDEFYADPGIGHLTFRLEARPHFPNLMIWECQHRILNCEHQIRMAFMAGNPAAADFASLHLNVDRLFNLVFENTSSNVAESNAISDYLHGIEHLMFRFHTSANLNHPCDKTAMWQQLYDDRGAKMRSYFPGSAIFRADLDRKLAVKPPCPAMMRVQINTIMDTPHILKSAETVHISSITAAIQKALDVIDCHAAAAAAAAAISDSECINALTKELYGNIIMRSFNFKYWHFYLYCANTCEIYNDQITYTHLLAQIWRIVSTHPQKSELIARLRTEIDDSVGTCFVGHIHRAINALTLFVDGVSVVYSHEEEFQLKVQQIVARLRNGAVTFDSAKAEMTEAVKLTEPATAQSWLDALEDYRN